MGVVIRCKKPGFRRCGIAHPAGPVEYPADTFDKKQMDILLAEPMLLVEVIPEEKEQSDTNLLEGNLDPAHLETMHINELRKLAKDLKLKVPAKATRKDLVALIATQPVFVTEDEIINESPEENQQSALGGVDEVVDENPGDEQ